MSSVSKYGKSQLCGKTQSLKCEMTFADSHSLGGSEAHSSDQAALPTRSEKLHI